MSELTEQSASLPKYKIGDIIYLKEHYFFTWNIENKIGIIASEPQPYSYPIDPTPAISPYAYSVLFGNKLINLIPEDYLIEVTPYEENVK